MAEEKDVVESKLSKEEFTELMYEFLKKEIKKETSVDKDIMLKK